MNGNGTAQGVGLRDAAAKLGISARSVRRYVQRLGLPKMHAPADAPGRWARVLLSADSLDAIAASVSKGTEPRPTPGVRGDTAEDSPGQGGGDNGQTWTSPGQDSGQPRTTLLAPDTLPGRAGGLPALPDAALERLGAVIRQAVAEGLQDGLRAAQGLGDAPQAAQRAGGPRIAQDGLQAAEGGQRPSRGLRALQGVAYGLLLALMGWAAWIAWSLAARMEDLAK